jgi:hypothetical protein
VVGDDDEGDEEDSDFAPLEDVGDSEGEGAGGDLDDEEEEGGVGDAQEEEVSPVNVVDEPPPSPSGPRRSARIRRQSSVV